jgi:hypothetical protein
VEVVNTLKVTTDEAFLIKVGKLVRKLSEVTERRRAEGTWAPRSGSPSFADSRSLAGDVSHYLKLILAAPLFTTWNTSHMPVST